jgi:hypothetical protein
MISFAYQDPVGLSLFKEIYWVFIIPFWKGCFVVSFKMADDF